MRRSLWPDSSDDHLQEINKFFSNDSKDVVEALVLERTGNKLGGFIEINVRNYAEGSNSKNVPHIEGWYIDEGIRNCGHGKALMDAAEKWAIANGFNELASDSGLENIHGIAVHKALGFTEVGRGVCFIKKLG